ncbi:hypothetical protein KBD20_01100 [Candidatus Saccharibacteria bacterium]|nr:hypothetical protein [Candidatus Saccharibacteria bacterium]
MTMFSSEACVRKIENRALTPFFNAIGSEASYGYATRIVDSASIRGYIPDDAPYGETIHNLATAVAQICAESGYIYRTGPLSFSSSGRRVAFSRALLANRGLADEADLGSLLGVGQDLWNRMTLDERSNLSSAVSPTGLRSELAEHPSEQELYYLNFSGVLSGGFMRVLGTAALDGYLWGRGDEVQLFEKVEIMPVGESNKDSYIWIAPGTSKGVRQKPITETVFKRGLDTARLERAREIEIKSIFDEILAQIEEPVSS